MIKLLKEIMSENLELYLQDFAQEYGGIDYNDISELKKCWDKLENATTSRIRKFVSKIRKACKETGLDAYELSQEYPEDKENCDQLVKHIKSAITVCKNESFDLKENDYSETDEFTLIKEMNHWIKMLKKFFVDDSKAQKAIADYFYHDDGKHQEDFRELQNTVKTLRKLYKKLDDIVEEVEEKEYNDKYKKESLINESYGTLADYLENHLDSWYGRLNELADDISDLGLDPEEVNPGYIIVTDWSEEEPVSCKITLGGTPRTISLEKFEMI